MALLAACTAPPPEPVELTSGSEPISERIVLLLEQKPRLCSETPASPLAEAFFRAGEVAFAREKFSAAAQRFAEAARRFDATPNRCRQVDALNARGRALTWGTQYAAARAEYQLAIDLAEESGYLFGVAQALNNLGALEARAQSFRPALEHYAGARALWRHLDRRFELLLVQQNTGVAQFNLGRLDVAEHVLTEAAHGFEQLGTTGELQHGICLMWLGRVQVARHDLAVAEQTLTDALAILRAHKPRVWLAGGLDALARLELETGRLDDAEAALEEARGLLAPEDRHDRANLLGNFAELYERRGRLRRALKYCRRVHALIEKLEPADTNLLLHVLFIEARARWRLGQPKRAAALMERLMNHLEAFRSQASGELLASFFTVRRTYYDFYVDLLLEQGRTEAAFDTAELARARSFLDRLIWSPSEVRASAPPRLVERDRLVRAELAAIGQRLETKSLAPKLAARARQLRFELAWLEAEMRAVGGGARAAVTPLRLAEIQPMLDAKTKLLVYWLGNQRSVLWEIDRTAVRCHADLPGRDRLEAAALALQSYFGSGIWARRPAQRELDDLARLLLGPLADRELPERLVIIPDGALLLVPFGALPSQAPADRGQLLFENHDIILNYSLSAMAAIQARAEERREGQEIELALVADPVTSPDDPRLPAHLAPSSQTPSRWPRLPNAQEETQAIMAWVQAPRRRVFLGFDATREAVLSGALRGARNIHILAHGELDPANPELSFILLSTYDAAGRQLQGQLKPEDFNRLDLDADLVVLSGCNTATGKPTRNEGPLGLPQSFLYSGAAGVIASLGAVDDEATSTLMQALYRELFENHQPASRALHRAQLELARSDRWRDPAYWASFVLLGDWKT